MLRNTGFVMRLRVHACPVRHTSSRLEQSGNPPTECSPPAFAQAAKALVVLQLNQSVARHIQILDEDLP
jgi:hypothetical protein